MEQLFGNVLPVAPWVLATAWAAIFVATHFVIKAAQAALKSQPHVIVSDYHEVTRALEPRYIAGQLLFTLIIFAIALFLGGAYSTFFAGGYVVASAVALGLNYHGLMYARALHRDGYARGEVTHSASFAFTNVGHQALGGALACLVLGLILTNLALLGGAFFLGSTGIGYLRKAK